jgi:hypothetical protein
MRTDAEIDALFDATGPRAEAVGARYRRVLPLRVASVAFGCLPIVAVAIAVLTGWAARFRETPFSLAAGGLVAVGLHVGGLLFRRFTDADAPIHDLADREIVQPLAALLLEDAVVSHPSLPPSDWQAARLLPETDGRPWLVTRISGRIAGLRAVLDEGAILFTAAGDDPDAPWKFDGWRVRVDLPFAVGGHLRVRAPVPEPHLRVERRGGFAPVPQHTALLGDGRTVEIAPRYHNDVAPEALVTEALIDLLRSDHGLQLAASGSELWILAQRERHAFKGAYRGSFDRDVWRAAARSMGAVERLTRAIVSAGGH